MPLGIQWGCQVTTDVADDPALLALMARSGCIAALVGFESLEADNLRQMHKAWMLKRQDPASAVARFHAHGIIVYGSFIFGYDADTPETMARTIAFAIRSKLFLANISPLTPMPGSRLYDRLSREGRLRYDAWWLDPRYGYGDVVYQPAGMTPEALREGCRAARAAFYGYGSSLAGSRPTRDRPPICGCSSPPTSSRAASWGASSGRHLGAAAGPVAPFEWAAEKEGCVVIRRRRLARAPGLLDALDAGAGGGAGHRRGRGCHAGRAGGGREADRAALARSGPPTKPRSTPTGIGRPRPVAPRRFHGSW